MARIILKTAANIRKINSGAIRFLLTFILMPFVDKIIIDKIKYPDYNISK